MSRKNAEAEQYEKQILAVKKGRTHRERAESFGGKEQIRKWLRRYRIKKKK